MTYENSGSAPAEAAPRTLDLRQLRQEFLSLEMLSWDVYRICLRSLHCTENELWILLEIDTAGKTPLCQADIARRLSLPMQTVNSALLKMMKRGWIELAPMPDNRKSKQVRFTEQGLAECRPVLEQIHDAEDRALSALSDREIMCLIQWTRRYTTALEQNLKELFAPEN